MKFSLFIAFGLLSFLTSGSEFKTEEEFEKDMFARNSSLSNNLVTMSVKEWHSSPRGWRTYVEQTFSDILATNGVEEAIVCEAGWCYSFTFTPLEIELGFNSSLGQWKNVLVPSVWDGLIPTSKAIYSQEEWQSLESSKPCEKGLFVYYTPVIGQANVIRGVRRVVTYVMDNTTLFKLVETNRNAVIEIVKERLVRPRDIVLLSDCPSKEWKSAWRIWYEPPLGFDDSHIVVYSREKAKEEGYWYPDYGKELSTQKIKDYIEKMEGK